MKNTVRAALVMLMLAGGYAGLATPAPAMAQPTSITLQEGTDPTPTSPRTCVPTPTKPCPVGTIQE
jgi:hypothetical protein